MTINEYNHTQFLAMWLKESSIARESDLALPILAGAEIGVASTKAFTCQLTLLLSLAIKAATERGTK